MPPNISSLSTLLISIASIVGLVSHDNRLQDVVVSTSSPHVIAFDGGGLNQVFASHHHIHSDSMSDTMKFDQPSIQPREKDGRKYAARKKTVGHNVDSDYCWPSI